MNVFERIYINKKLSINLTIKYCLYICNRKSMTY